MQKLNQQLSSTDSAIFSALTDFVTNQDFLVMQMNFFEKYKSSFSSSEEENKIEHTKIFQEYVALFDQILDSKLLEKFSKEEVDGFNGQFEANQ